MQGHQIVKTLTDILGSLSRHNGELQSDDIVGLAMDASINLGDLVGACNRVDEDIVRERVVALIHPERLLDAISDDEITKYYLDNIQSDSDRERLGRLERFETLAREAASLQAEVLAGISPERAGEMIDATSSMLRG
jgi:hypothetical protein